MYRIKKYAWFLVLVFCVALYFVEPELRGAVKQGSPGATSSSSGSFSITLKIEPCVREIIHPDPDDPESRCFSAAGIDAVVISCESERVPSVIIRPEDNRFCLGEALQDSFIEHFKQQMAPGSELIFISPE